MISFEEVVVTAAHWMKMLLEASSVVIIAIGLVVSLYLLIVRAIKDERHSFTAVRLAFARHLVLALEFQLGADIVSTAVAPTWDQIGKLAAIAVIRTALNYFLTKEMQNEAAELERV